MEPPGSGLLPRAGRGRGPLPSVEVTSVALWDERLLVSRRVAAGQAPHAVDADELAAGVAGQAPAALAGLEMDRVGGGAAIGATAPRAGPRPGRGLDRLLVAAAAVLAEPPDDASHRRSSLAGPGEPEGAGVVDLVVVASGRHHRCHPGREVAFRPVQAAPGEGAPPHQ